MPGLEDGRKADEPCTIVIFGASGDLTARKLIPALYHLYTDGQMPASFRVVGFARREKTSKNTHALAALMPPSGRTSPTISVITVAT